MCVFSDFGRCGADLRGCLGKVQKWPWSDHRTLLRMRQPTKISICERVWVRSDVCIGTNRTRQAPPAARSPNPLGSGSRDEHTFEHLEQRTAMLDATADGAEALLVDQLG